MICEPGMIISSRTNRILAIHGEIPNRLARPAQTPARMRPSRGTDEALTAERLHDSTTPSATDTLDDHASGAPGPRHRGSPWNFPDEAALRSGLFDSVARVYRLGTSIQGGREQEVTMPATASAPVRRRPSGEPPPLPREDRWTRRIWVLAAVLLLGAGLSVLVATTDVVQTADQAVLSWFAEARSSALTDAAKLVALLTTFAAVMTLRCATVLVLVVYRRFRHLVVFLATLVVTDWVVVRLLFVELPRPTVPVLVDADAYAFPSKAISTLAITRAAMSFVLAARGRGRNRLRAGFTAVLVLVVLAELYLAGDHLSGMVYAAILAP